MYDCNVHDRPLLCIVKDYRKQGIPLCSDWRTATKIHFWILIPKISRIFKNQNWQILYFFYFSKKTLQFLRKSSKFFPFTVQCSRKRILYSIFVTETFGLQVFMSIEWKCNYWTVSKSRKFGCQDDFYIITKIRRISIGASRISYELWLIQRAHLFSSVQGRC